MGCYAARETGAPAGSRFAGLHRQLEPHEVPTRPRAHFMGQWGPILLAAAEAGSRPTARPHRQLRWYRAVPDPQSGFGLAVGSS